jgi:hypothetical protein
MLSNRRNRRSGFSDELAKDDVRQLALEAAHRLLIRLACSPMAIHEELGVEVPATAGDRHHVKRKVELTVASSVKPVTFGPARRSFQGSGPH